MGDYLTLTEATRWTGSPLGDDQTEDLNDVISAVEREIEQYCQRRFAQTSSSARDFAATSTTLLRLGPFNDLVSVSSVATDTTGDGTFDTTVTDYQLEPRNTAGPETRPYTSLRRISGTWPVASYSDERQALVRITGVWGWPSVPAPVKQAARIQVARIFKRTDSPFGVAGVSDFGVMRLTARLDPDVQHMLEPYRILTGFA